jgi:hypothetical protein
MHAVEKQLKIMEQLNSKRGDRVESGASKRERTEGPHDEPAEKRQRVLRSNYVNSCYRVERIPASRLQQAPCNLDLERPL